MFRAALRGVRHELGLKVVSVLAAICLWFYVINTEDPYRTEAYQAPIRTVSVPQGLEVVKTRPEAVTARLHGRLSALQREALASVRAVADLSSGKTGQNTVGLRITGLPERVTLETLDRPTANVWLDHRVAERRAVGTVVVGTPAEGCELLADPAVEPSRVQITGSASAIETVAELVVRIDVSGMSEKQTVKRTVEALDDRGAQVKGVKLVPSQVSVELPIFQVTSKVVPVRARVGSPPEGYTVSEVRSTPDTVTLKGAPEALRGVREIKTKWQGIGGLTSTRAFHVPLVVPNGLWAADNVREVSVRVTVKPEGAPAPEDGETAEPQSGTAEDTPGTDADIVTPDSDEDAPEEPDQGDTGEQTRTTKPSSTPASPTAPPEPAGGDRPTSTRTTRP